MNEKSGIPVLVTGFGPFGDNKVNVSWEVAKTLPSLDLESHGLDLILHEIPVAYSVVNKEVPLLWKKHNPRLVIHMGVTSIGSEIALEKIAHKAGYTKLDIYGKIPENGTANGKHDFLQTTLNIEDVAERIINSVETDVPIHISSNAGRYLCEFLYYTSLNINNLRTIFIHVPQLDKGYTILDMASVVKQIIILLLQQIELIDCVGEKHLIKTI